MKAAFVVKYTKAFPGRERASMAYGRDVDDYFGKRAVDGLCTEPKWFFAPAGENVWFVEGEDEALAGLLASPEVQKLLAKGTILLQEFGYGLYQEGRDEIFTRFEEALTELGIS